MRTFKNFSRKADKYGDVHFVSFLGATLSRLAYLDDNKFLANYTAIMGPVIQPELLQSINNISSNELSNLLDDETIFGLNAGGKNYEKFKDYEYDYKGKKYIDFLKLNMPQNINIINGEIKGTPEYKIIGEKAQSNDIKYISIGWSNYGEIYVVADKRMPNTIFLLFRGTYSAKTAALYTKPTSLVPLTVCKDYAGNPETFLYGIFKASTEMIHTIIEAMRYLATDFLEAREPNSVKIFTTGHSLGGAMCTNFAYLWMGIKKTKPYTDAPYNVLGDNIVCISLGSPRCMGSSVATKFCNFVSQNKILYLRISTRGDPVPSLPPKTGYQHPCSNNEDMRKVVSENCNSQLTMRPKPNVKYSGDLDCQNYKTRTYIPNPLSHTIYLDILYLYAVDIVNFLKGINPVGKTREIRRTPTGSTVCRLIMGQEANHKGVFFDVNDARLVPTMVDAAQEKELASEKSVVSKQETIIEEKEILAQGGGMPSFKIGGKVKEDIRMTPLAFNKLIDKMIPIQGDLCPKDYEKSGLQLASDVFINIGMPDLSCPGAIIGGKMKNKLKNTIRKHKKTRKNKVYKTRKNKVYKKV
jgi:hypothetical protein